MSNPFGGGSPRQANSNPFDLAPPPGSANPFQAHTPPGQAYSYDVQTTYMPEHSVPAVPAARPQVPPSYQPAPVGAWSAGTVPAVPHPAPTAAAGQQGPNKAMPFMSSTALPTASGNIGSGPTGGRGPQQPQQPAPQGTPGGGQAERDTQPLLTGRTKDDHTKYAFYNVRRYRPYFDVDTTEVLWRVGSSFIGVFRANFMQVTQERPDLYGPFWIATTLIFVTAVAGNYASYIGWRESQSAPSPSPSPLPSPAPGASPDVSPSPSSGNAATQDQWFNDYAKLGESAGMFYGYTFALSLLLWLGLRYMRAELHLANMFCVYGYAMTIFIPISLVCIVPIEAVRWGTVMGGTLLSGAFLIMNLKERIMPAGAGKAIPVLIIVLALHVLMGLCLKLFFFSYHAK